MMQVGEIFSGCGGMALGARGAGIEHVWAIDHNQDACATFAHNVSELVFCKDARDIVFEETYDIDGLVFGFPCNDFSLIGERKGLKGKYGPLYKVAVEGVKVKRPRFFVGENVPGIRNINKGKTFEKILADFRSLGYDVFPCVYRFEEYGVPQTRHRVIIVGFRKELNIKFEPRERNIQKKTAAQALEGIPADAPNNELTSHPARVVERLKLIKPGQNVWDADLPEHLQINSRSTISQTYKRLDPDKPAYTVTGSGGGGSHMYHWEEPRALTNREREHDYKLFQIILSFMVVVGLLENRLEWRCRLWAHIIFLMIYGKR